MPFSFGGAYNSGINSISKVPTIKTCLTNPFIIALIITTIILIIVLISCYHNKKSMRKQIIMLVLSTLISVTIVLVIRDSIVKCEQAKKEYSGSGTNYISKYSLGSADAVEITPSLHESGPGHRITKYEKDFIRPQEQRQHTRSTNEVNYDVNYDKHNLSNSRRSDQLEQTDKLSPGDRAMKELDEVMIGTNSTLNDELSDLHGFADEEVATPEKLLGNQYEVIKSTGNSAREILKYQQSNLMPGLKDL